MATANWLVGCAARMLLRIVGMFACTLEMTGPMLVVVSTRRTMSGLGGIDGVATTLLIVVEPPSGRLRVTVAGVTLMMGSFCVDEDHPPAPAVSWRIADPVPTHKDKI